MKRILSQSANGRAIDCTDLLPGNGNYVDGGGDWMIVYLHKPADQETERVELLLSNPGKKKIDFHVDFNGQALPVRLDRGETKALAFTVHGWDANAPVVSISKTKGDPLLVMGGAES